MKNRMESMQQQIKNLNELSMQYTTILIDEGHSKSSKLYKRYETINNNIDRLQSDIDELFDKIAKGNDTEFIDVYK